MIFDSSCAFLITAGDKHVRLEKLEFFQVANQICQGVPQCAWQADADWGLEGPAEEEHEQQHCQGQDWGSH